MTAIPYYLLLFWFLLLVSSIILHLLQKRMLYPSLRPDLDLHALQHSPSHVILVIWPSIHILPKKRPVRGRVRPRLEQLPHPYNLPWREGDHIWD